MGGVFGFGIGGVGPQGIYITLRSYSLPVSPFREFLWGSDFNYWVFFIEFVVFYTWEIG